MTEQSMIHGKEKSQTASKQNIILESATYGRTETLLLKNKGTELVRKTDIACTIISRDYKGFGNQPMNGVIEWK